MSGGSGLHGCVLAVDDDAGLLRVIARVLSAAGHEIVGVSDGHGALDALCDRSPLGFFPPRSGYQAVPAESPDTRASARPVCGLDPPRVGRSRRASAVRSLKKPPPFPSSRYGTGFAEGRGGAPQKPALVTRSAGRMPPSRAQQGRFA